MSGGNETKTGQGPSNPTREHALAELLRVAGPRQQPSEEVEAWVYDRLVTDWEKKVQARRWKQRVVPMAMAASILVAVAVAFMFVRSPETTPVFEVARITGEVEYAKGSDAWNPITPATAIEAGIRLRTSATGRIALAGVDGSGIIEGGGLRLDHNTALILDSPKNMRLMAGAIYLDTGNANAVKDPYEIETSFGIVRDVGTQFEVRLSSSDVRINVREGTAILDSRAGSHEATAGQSLYLNQRGQVTRSRVSPTDLSWDWLQDITPMFDIDGRSLEEFLTWVSRETGLKVIYTSNSTRSDAQGVQLKGSVEGLKPLDALPVVLGTTDLDYDLTEHEIIIHDQKLEK